MRKLHFVGNHKLAFGAGELLVNGRSIETPLPLAADRGIVARCPRDADNSHLQAEHKQHRLSGPAILFCAAPDKQTKPRLAPSGRMALAGVVGPLKGAEGDHSRNSPKGMCVPCWSPDRICFVWHATKQTRPPRRRTSTLKRGLAGLPAIARSVALVVLSRKRELARQVPRPADDIIKVFEIKRN
jgi:hypothetical protein